MASIKSSPSIRMENSTNVLSPRVPPSPDSASIHSFSQIEGFVKPDRILEHTRFGPWKNWSRLTRLEKIFLWAWLIALVISLILTIVKIANASSLSSDTTTYGSILIIATLFSFFYVITGVHQEQPHEMLALCITNLIVLGYVVINFFNSTKRHQGQVDNMKLIRLAFTGAFSVVFLPLSLYLAHKYWTCKTLITFAVGSVNPEKQAMAQVLFMFLSAITFDLQLQLNFLILVLRQGIGSASLTQILILVFGVIITLIWTVLGRLAARREQGAILISFLVFSFPNFIYAGYAFATLTEKSVNSEMFRLTLLSGVSAVIMRILILVLTYFLYKNFGKGLKDTIFQWDLPKEELERRRRSTFASPQETESAKPRSTDGL